ncbi:MAG: response regulator [Ignavibacteriales bacterium]|nr:response regulator [Ignavibacteriales bacterium]
MIDATLKNAKILIVDDHQANIDILTGLIEAMGFTNYITTTDPRKVVELYEEFQPDLLLLDLQMPHLTGFQIMIQLKVLVPENSYFPILVLTADVTKESKMKALANGAVDFLTKPFDLLEVDLRIKNLLKTRYLHQQLENQNQILEEKVKERTAELEKLNQELIIAKDHAEEMNRVKNYFLSNMSHELRTPLISILGFAELLESEITDPEHLEMLKSIREGGERLNNTLSSILEISKLEAEKGKVNLMPSLISEEINKKIELLKPMAQSKKLFIKNEIANQTIKAKIDKELFGQALFNLLNNAIKFTKQGGVFVLLKLDRNENCDWAVIKIIDTGIGISKEHMEKILIDFRQASEGLSRNYEGIGIGLSISKKIIELMKGRLEIESEVGKGTTVTIWLPAVIEEERIKEIVYNRTRTIESKLEEGTEESIPSILLVEDNPLNRDLIHRMLKNKAKVTDAEDGASAIAYAQKMRYDLVLMDINLGEGIDGVEAMYLIRRIPGYMKVPIIAVTAYVMQGDKERFLREGFDEYMSKPFTRELLVEVLSKRVGRRL